MPALLFLLLPILELVVFIQVGARIGVLWVLFFIFISAVAGFSVLRNYSALSVLQAQKKMAQGQLPFQAIGQGIWLALAGLLLIIPGFITSFLGVLLLLPFTRKALGGFLFKQFVAKQGQVHPHTHTMKDVDDVVIVEKYRVTSVRKSSSNGQVIEGEFREDN